MLIPNIRELLRQELPELSERFGVSSLRLFGSRVRDDARPDSDIDVLVVFHSVPGLLRSIELENHLSDLLGMQVDLVMEDALKPYIKDRVLREAVPV